MFVFLDLDQTLADNTHRVHHIKKSPKDWDTFEAPDLVGKDTVIAGALRVLNQLIELKYDVVILTGRHESLRDTTMRWMLEHLNLSVPDTHLLMRGHGNMLSAAEYKKEQVLNFKQGLENRGGGFLFIDDNANVCATLAAFGVVMKAPECWSVMFPVEVPPAEVAPGDLITEE